ncbi:hypothetical protein K0M31_004727 [Melipona bicolor]|uniref:Uncharacterized protein n=1 Tax=Melipona bicolor TaxID=60889 RepID=A0AA40KN07_9HYME|nr:hypothetical protein K0M31_004727 [Melipona bicolor]
MHLELKNEPLHRNVVGRSCQRARRLARGLLKLNEKKREKGGEGCTINLPTAIEQFGTSYESATSGVYRTIESIRPNEPWRQRKQRAPFLRVRWPTSSSSSSCALSLKNNEEEAAGSDAKHHAMHPRKIECGDRGTSEETSRGTRAENKGLEVNETQGKGGSNLFQWIRKKREIVGTRCVLAETLLPPGSFL